MLVSISRSIKLTTCQQIDDDMVWIDDQAIPELLRLTLEHPEAHSVMSNIVNNAFNHLHHYRTGAVWPYLADQNSPLINGSVSWRPSKLPDFTGDFPNSTISNGWLHQYEPPSEGHRWLPLRGANPVKAMLHTPYSNELPDPRQIDFVHGGWPLAAQSHYSLFENLERKNLDAYDFGNKDGFQNLWFGHYSINMMAIRGSYVALKPFWDEEAFPPAAEHGDEGLLTEIVPKLLGMPVLLATRSLAAHYAYRADRQAVLKTDVLGRYRSYANEMVCSARNQKFAFDTLPP